MTERKKMIIDATIQRIPQPDCTIGILTVHDSKFRCCTIERPYLENENYISCVPPGVYEFFKRGKSSGTVIQLKGVVNRTAIQIHIGNWVEDSVGCILPGRTFALESNKGPMVTSSGDTMSDLLENLPETGVLEIK